MTGRGFRRPREDDHQRVADVVDEWWGGRRMRPLVGRLWFRYLTRRSWIADREDGRLGGFLLGLISPDDPGTALVHLAGVDPNVRRRGLGRALYRAFLEDVHAAGVRRVEATTWPDDRACIAFHRALGFAPDAGPGVMPLYGTPAYPDYEGPGEDRVVLVLELDEGSSGPPATSSSA